MTKTVRKNLTFWIGVLLLGTVLAACGGGVSQPQVTPTPIEPTEVAITPYPGAGGGVYPYPSPHPSDSIVYPPVGKDLPVYPAPLQPYPQPQQPYPAPWQPQVADQNLQRGEAFVEGMDILVMESFPRGYTLNLSGTLPTPCHQLRVEVAAPDSQNRIQVSVYSVVDPNVICVQMLAPFEQGIPLQGLPDGKYTVLVNGKEAGNIELP
jgi:hypothetical protein